MSFGFTANGANVPGYPFPIASAAVPMSSPHFARTPAAPCLALVAASGRKDASINHGRITMSIRMTKVLLALGLMAAAGSSNAFYVLSTNGNLPYSRYCAQIWRGQSGWGVMESTMLKCQQKLDEGRAMG